MMWPVQRARTLPGAAVGASEPLWRWPGWGHSSKGSSGGSGGGLLGSSRNLEQVHLEELAMGLGYGWGPWPTWIGLWEQP